MDNVTCDRYYSRFNRTRVFELGGDPRGGGYEGIPDNLLLNAVGFLILLALFAILRRVAWDYGRIALISRREKRWTTLFYGGDVIADGSHVAAAAGAGDGGAKTHQSQVSLDSHVDPNDKALHWIAAVFKLSDEHYRKKHGGDVVQYLRLQRYLIMYMSLITIVSLAVLLPVNLTGSVESGRLFSQSTISNLSTDSPALWAHTILAPVYLIIAVLLMRRYSSAVVLDRSADDVSNSLMISRVPRKACDDALIRKHLEEAYSGVAVCSLSFAYNVRRLIDLETRRCRAKEGRESAEAVKSSTGRASTLVPYFCGRLCCCCQRCGVDKVDALTYYADQEEKLTRACDEARRKALADGPIGVLFVTLADEEMAHRIFTDFQSKLCKQRALKPSSVSRQLGLEAWRVEYSQHPEDIIWENLMSASRLWWLKAAIINAAVLILLFFLTTPSVLLNTIDDGDDKGNSTSGGDTKTHHNAVYVQFLPTILLWFFSCLLPWIVYYSDQFIGHWTRTAEHHQVMQKSFIFLMLMVIILPSLGLSSVHAFIEFAFSSRSLKGIRWRCIFQPDNGAFFVNYMITTALVGNALQLLRFPELFMYAIRLLAARSMSEKAAVRRANLWEFQFGQEYAWFLCMLSVSVVYSVSIPLITPFGLFYIVGKHLVDRYNLYFAYKPSRIDKRVHTSAINYVIVSAVVLQFNMLFFNIIRTKWERGLPIFSGTVVAFALMFFAARLLFTWCKNFMPSKYKEFENGSVEKQRMARASNPLFVPSVLIPRPDDETSALDLTTAGSLDSETVGRHPKEGEEEDENEADGEDEADQCSGMDDASGDYRTSPGYTYG